MFTVHSSVEEVSVQGQFPSFKDAFIYWTCSPRLDPASCANANACARSSSITSKTLAVLDKTVSTEEKKNTESELRECKSVAIADGDSNRAAYEVCV